ncbi:MAG: helix-turn-helix domain-containing protein [Rhodospirillaceae bacterium]|nr:helix-turn-helix domain-containing protein [Rhodospirillaceae bacterium]
MARTQQQSTERVAGVRALVRGLDVLRVLNALNGATPNQVARHTRLARGTTYRLIETLAHEGYLRRDAADGKYRATLLVRGLGDGVDDDAWIGEVARPRLAALGRTLKWPLGLSTLHGAELLVRETTDRDSALALKRYSTGHRLSLASTASGRAYMAFATDDARELLLDVLAQSANPKDRIARNRPAFQLILDRVRANGYARSSTPIEGESAIAVPVFSSGRLLAVLALRYIDSALAPRQVVRRYFEPLRDGAVDIGAAFAAAAGHSNPISE